MGLKKKLVVKNSKIHGKGLFSTIKLKRGTVLGYCKSRFVEKPTSHTLWLGDGRYAEVSCKLKYINHHKSPNVIYYDDLSVVVLRDIQADEELTHDYGSDWP